MVRRYLPLKDSIAHAHGILLNGSFVPTSDAASLSTAPHFNSPSTSITVRFSSSTGLPQIPDTDPNAQPRGFAIRFNLGDHVHTDIIAHSTPLFPARTGAEFLEFFKAVAASPPGTPSPSPIETFLSSHPPALSFVTAPKPVPSSFANQAFYGVNAYKFISAEGKETFVRYRIVPVEGEKHLNDIELQSKDANFLFSELSERLSKEPISFKIVAQVAEQGDVVNDATVHWPEDRKIVELGVAKLTSFEAQDAKLQKKIIYDPIPRVKGIEPSDDPLLELRAAVYLISGRERRNA